MAEVIAKIIGFALLSFCWWSLAIVALFVTALPCGMGPDASCDMGPAWAILSVFIVAIFGYVALCGLLYRKWIR